MTYAVFIVLAANCLTSLIARGALFLKVTPYNRLLMWMVYSLVTMSAFGALSSAMIRKCSGGRTGYEMRGGSTVLLLLILC
jgi:hypothetical protein